MSDGDIGEIGSIELSRMSKSSQRRKARYSVENAPREAYFPFFGTNSRQHFEQNRRRITDPDDDEPCICGEDLDFASVFLEHKASLSADPSPIVFTPKAAKKNLNGCNFGFLDDAENLSTRTKAELLVIRNQVEELKQKMKDKEELLLSIKQTDLKLLEEVDKADLRTEVEALSKEVMRRDFLLQQQLAEKNAEIASLKFMVESLQKEIWQRDHRAAQMETDLDELRFEVAALRYESQCRQYYQQVCTCRSQLDMLMNQQADENDGTVETARLRYLAALNAAMDKPVDETIALAAELRGELLRCLPTTPQLGLPDQRWVCTLCKSS